MADEQKEYDAYAARSAADNTWEPQGIWEHASGKRMAVTRCDWVSDGLCGEVYWLGVDPEGTITPLGHDSDSTTGWKPVPTPTYRDNRGRDLLNLLGEMQAECLQGAYNLDPKDGDEDSLDHAIYAYRATLWVLKDGYWRHPDLRWRKDKGDGIWKGEDGEFYSGDHPSRFELVRSSRRLAAPQGGHLGR